jgi:hypothetical protein
VSNEERTAHGAIIVRDARAVASLADWCEFEVTACEDSYEDPPDYGGWISVGANEAARLAGSIWPGIVRAWPCKAPSVPTEHARELSWAKNDEFRRLPQYAANAPAAYGTALPRGDVGHAEAEPRWDREEPTPLSDNQKIIRLLERILRALERK